MKRVQKGIGEIFIIGLLAIATTATFLVVKVSKERHKTIEKPTVVEGLSIEIYIDPERQNISDGSDFSLMVDSGSEKIGFVRVKILFDKTKVKLPRDVEITGNLKTVVRKTKYVVANKEGVVEIVVGLKPGDDPPTGSFEIAKLSFTPVEKSENGITKLLIDSKDVQVVSLDEKQARVKTKDAVIELKSE